MIALILSLALAATAQQPPKLGIPRGEVPADVSPSPTPPKEKP